jgi:hypothetical protein
MGVPDNEERQPVMTTFDERERGFEARFAHDEELRFLALARRDKLFALWTVARLGATGAAREQLIHDLLGVQGFPHHDEALLRLAGDRLGTAAAADAPAALERLGVEAREQLLHGDATPIDLSAAPTP